MLSGSLSWICKLVLPSDLNTYTENTAKWDLLGILYYMEKKQTYEIC